MGITNEHLWQKMLSIEANLEILSGFVLLHTRGSRNKDEQKVREDLIDEIDEYLSERGIE